MLHYRTCPLILDQRGLILGRYAVLAKSDIKGRIDIDGQMPRIVGMLKAAYDGDIPEYIPRRIAGTLRSWNLGQTGMALTKLTQIGLPDPFDDFDAARRLTKAEWYFDKGLPPEELEKFVSVNVYANPPPPGMGSGGGDNEDDSDDSDDDDDSGGGMDNGTTATSSNHDVSNEPRIPSGQPGAGEWTVGEDENGSSRNSESGLTYVAGKDSTTPADKQVFIDEHLADAESAASQLNVPVENILGLSALESGWGTSRFAKDGNNYFGMHYPADFSTGYMIARDSGAKVATYKSYGDSLKSFIARSGSLVYGVRDPTKFATILQNSGKFGVTKNGKKISSYVGDTSATIERLRPLIRNRTL